MQESRIGEQMNSCEMEIRRKGPNSVKVVPVIEVKTMKGARGDRILGFERKFLGRKRH